MILAKVVGSVGEEIEEEQSMGEGEVLELGKTGEDVEEEVEEEGEEPTKVGMCVLDGEGEVGTDQEWAKIEGKGSMAKLKMLDEEGMKFAR